MYEEDDESECVTLSDEIEDVVAVVPIERSNSVACRQKIEDLLEEKRLQKLLSEDEYYSWSG